VASLTSFEIAARNTALIFCNDYISAKDQRHARPMLRNATSHDLIMKIGWNPEVFTLPDSHKPIDSHGPTDPHEPPLWIAVLAIGFAVVGPIILLGIRHLT
jgi:hypothetical protein